MKNFQNFVKFVSFCKKITGNVRIHTINDMSKFGYRIVAHDGDWHEEFLLPWTDILEMRELKDFRKYWDKINHHQDQIAKNLCIISNILENSKEI